MRRRTFAWEQEMRTQTDAENEEFLDWCSRLGKVRTALKDTCMRPVPQKGLMNMDTFDYLLEQHGLQRIDCNDD